MARTKQTARDNENNHKMTRLRQALSKKTIHNDETEMGSKRLPKKKSKRSRPGSVALREIRRYQKSYELLTRRLPFQRLVKEISRNEVFGNVDLRFQSCAIEALRVSARGFERFK